MERRLHYQGIRIISLVLERGLPCNWICPQFPGWSRTHETGEHFNITHHPCDKQASKIRQEIKVSSLKKLEIHRNPSICRPKMQDFHLVLDVFPSQPAVAPSCRNQSVTRSIPTWPGLKMTSAGPSGPEPWSFEWEKTYLLKNGWCEEKRSWILADLWIFWRFLEVSCRCSQQFWDLMEQPSGHQNLFCRHDNGSSQQEMSKDDNDDGSQKNSWTGTRMDQRTPFQTKYIYIYSTAIVNCYPGRTWPKCLPDSVGWKRSSFWRFRRFCKISVRLCVGNIIAIVFEKGYLWSQVSDFVCNSPETPKLDSTNSGKAYCTMTKKRAHWKFFQTVWPCHSQGAFSPNGRHMKIISIFCVVWMKNFGQEIPAAGLSGFVPPNASQSQPALFTAILKTCAPLFFRVSSGRLRPIGKHCPLRPSQVEKLKLSTTGGSG